MALTQRNGVTGGAREKKHFQTFFFLSVTCVESVEGAQRHFQVGGYTQDGGYYALVAAIEPLSSL